MLMTAIESVPAVNASVLWDRAVAAASGEL
jgi:hypothetical protein